jgi:hypothetical protein
METVKKNKRFSKKWFRDNVKEFTVTEGWFIDNVKGFVVAGILLFLVTVSYILIKENTTQIKENSVIGVNQLENKEDFREVLYDNDVNIYKLGFTDGYEFGYEDSKNGKSYLLKEKKDFINEEFKKSKEIFMQGINR